MCLARRGGPGVHQGQAAGKEQPVLPPLMSVIADRISLTAYLIYIISVIYRISLPPLMSINAGCIALTRIAYLTGYL